MLFTLRLHNDFVNFYVLTVVLFDIDKRVHVVFSFW